MNLKSDGVRDIVTTEPRRARQSNERPSDLTQHAKIDVFVLPGRGVSAAGFSSSDDDDVISLLASPPMLPRFAIIAAVK